MNSALLKMRSVNGERAKVLERSHASAASIYTSVVAWRRDGWGGGGGGREGVGYTPALLGVTRKSVVVHNMFT